MFRQRFFLAPLTLTLAFAVACGGDDSGGTEDGTTTDGEETGTETEGETESESDTGVPAGPTWYQDIAPLVAGKCSGCHRPNSIAPFSLVDYDSAMPWATVMADSVEAGTMPPFAAAQTDECQTRHGFLDDISLSDDETSLLRAWADAGAPMGDPSNAAPLPTPPDLTLPDADLRLTSPKPVTIEGNDDQFLCFSVDPGLTEDTYLEAAQIIAGNDSIVHHVLIYTDEDGSSEQQAGDQGYWPCPGGGINGDALIAAWAPGGVPTRTPPEAAFRIPAGARIIMNIHYHPTGAGAEVDPGTSIDLKWYDGRPDFVAEMALIGNFDNAPQLLPGPADDGSPVFRIPANAESHTESMQLTLPSEIPPLQLWSVSTHMHYVGYDMLLGIERANPGNEPASECLLHTPSYSFEWQRGYRYDAPFAALPTVKPGDTLTMRCTYNNSMSNPYVVEALDALGHDAPVDVFLGDDTLDEMCLGVYGISYINIYP